MLKPFSGKKNSKSRQNGAPKWRFLKKIGAQTLDIGFATPKRHFLARNCVVWRILRQNRFAPIHYTTFIGLDDDYGSFTLEPSSVKAVLKILSRRNGAQNDGFERDWGLNLIYWFRDPHMAFPCAEPRLFTYFASKSVRASEEPPPPRQKNSRVTLRRGTRNHACAESKPLNRFWINLASLWVSQM